MGDIFVSVGEPSGDVLASELVPKMQTHFPSERFFGIGGPRLRQLDCFEAVADIKQLSVMGFVEVIKHLPFIKRIEDRLLTEIARRKPKVAILVDYPGFHMRLAEMLKARDILVIQYVAPQLWAWGARRTKRLKAVTDLVVGIMPFEETFFREREVNFQYAGTPQVDRAKNALRSKSSLELPENKVLIGFFPGSRRGEISRVLPILVAARDLLRKENQGYHFVFSKAPNADWDVFSPLCLDEEQGRDIDSNAGEARFWRQGDTTLVQGRSLDLMSVMDSAVVTSGTATLECGLVKTPMTVAYKMNPTTYKIAKHLVKLDSISLVNLVAGKGIIREFIQDFSPQDLAKELSELAVEGPRRGTVISDLNTLDRKLKGDLPEEAARIIADFYYNASLSPRRL